MSENKKGLNPEAQTPENHTYKLNTIQVTRPLDKSEAAVLLLLTTPSGITGLDLLTHCHLISGRNVLTALERDLGIRLAKEREPNAVAGSHYRYRIVSRDDCRRVLTHLNRHKPGKPAPLTVEATSTIAAWYPASGTSTA